MDKYIMVTTTFNDKKEADKIINLLLGRRLVSCCQVVSIGSSYRWDGKVVKDNELLVLMKTKKSLYKQIEKLILEHHSYEVPEIVYYEIKNGYKDYLNWIGDEVSG